jgi:peptide-methionine (R)-S-oxide reductase
MPSDTKVRIVKSDAEWRSELTPEQYHVTREHGTERAFSGPYWNAKEDGLYRCVCCGKPLFSSETKFDSGTGWPSFFAPVEKHSVAEYKDRSLFMTRTEIRCADCDAHLGHVFDDGPEPTGLRYCMNGTALTFEKEERRQSELAAVRDAIREDVDDIPADDILTRLPAEHHGRSRA